MLPSKIMPTNSPALFTTGLPLLPRMNVGVRKFRRGLIVADFKTDSACLFRSNAAWPGEDPHRGDVNRHLRSILSCGSTLELRRRIKAIAARIDPLLMGFIATNA